MANSIEISDEDRCTARCYNYSKFLKFQRGIWNSFIPSASCLQNSNSRVWNMDCAWEMPLPKCCCTKSAFQVWHNWLFKQIPLGVNLLTGQLLHVNNYKC